MKAGWALVVLVAFAPLAHPQELADGFAFSRLPADAPFPDDWREITSPRIAPTRYTLVADGATTVLRAESRAAMSSLSRALQIDPARFPLLRWRWKISSLIERSDMRRRSQDDFPARVYVSFDYDIAKLPFLERSRLRIARALHGPDVPAAVLCYVWDRQAPVETIASSPYTARVKVIVVTSGAAQIGQWVQVERDLTRDYRSAFGEPPGRINAIAVATDTDNTESATVSYFSDVVFLSRSTGR